MTPRTAHLITWAASALLALAAGATVWLNVAHGAEIYAARLIAGLAGCL
jgi:hypothetical protein